MQVIENFHCAVKFPSGEQYSETLLCSILSTHHQSCFCGSVLVWAHEL